MKISWIKLANFGEYWHRKGTQILDFHSAETIVNSFHSIRGHLMRRFRGIPIFIGHPDDPEFPSKSDKIYGRIENLKIDGNALWILVKWTEIGRELFESGIIKYLSPRWVTTQAMDGKLLPSRLLSVGLTNHPNMRCDHVCSEAECDHEMPEVDLTARTVEDLQARELHGEPEISGDGSGECTVDRLGSGALRTESQTRDLWRHSVDKSNCERILELVFERMKNFSERYNDAWMAVKRRHPSLFNKNF
jgi:hypothetical protein